MAGNEFESFPPDQVSKEVVRAIGGWMAARKWELGKSFKPTKPSKLVACSQSKILSLHRGFLGSVRRLKATAKSLSMVPSQITPVRNAAGRPLVKYFGPDGQCTVKFGRSWWRRPLKEPRVRVPVPLLEEFGLRIRPETVEEIRERSDKSLFGAGAGMYYNSAYFAEMYRRICRDGEPVA